MDEARTRTWSTTFKQNTSLDPAKDKYLLKPKDDRTHDERGWMTVWRLDTGGAGALIRKTQSSDGGSNGTTGAINEAAHEKRTKDCCA